MLATFIDVVAKGGNMEIGFGPPANGKWQPEMIERLDYLGDLAQGQWRGDLQDPPLERWNEGKDIRFTRSKDGKYVYAISLKLAGRGSRSFAAPPARRVLPSPFWV